MVVQAGTAQALKYQLQILEDAGWTIFTVTHTKHQRRSLESAAEVWSSDQVFTIVYFRELK